MLGRHLQVVGFKAMLTRPNKGMAMRWLQTAAGLALLAGCYETRGHFQERQIRDGFDPKPITISKEAPAAPLVTRVLRVRVYADETYRVQSFRWQERITAQVRRASDVLEAQFGARFEIESLRTWAHQSPAEANLDPTLHALQQLDPAKDVDWVIGFCGAYPYPKHCTHLGAADGGGRHFVVRNMEDSDYRQWLRRVFDTADEARLSTLYDASLRHREMVTLLHEWAHTLAAPHEAASGSLMSGEYTPQLSAFSPGSIRVVALGLRHHAYRSPAGRRLWAAALRGLAGQADPDFDAVARQQLLETAQDMAKDPPATVPLRPADRAVRAQAEAALTRGHPETAEATLQPLLAHFGEDGSVLDLACRIAARKDKSSLDAAERCRDACLAGATLEACFMAVRASLDQGDGKGSDVVTETIQQRLLAEPTPDAVAVQRLAKLYLGMGQLGAAEALAARLGISAEALEIRAAVMRRRRQAGLPVRVLDPTREPAYLQTFDLARTELAQGGPRTALHTLMARWSTLPGAMALRAEELRQGRLLVAAEKLAADALVLFPDATCALRVAGQVAMDDGRWRAAEKRFRAWRDLDGADSEAWTWLARVLMAAGREDDARDVRRDYARQFKDILPP